MALWRRSRRAVTPAPSASCSLFVSTPHFQGRWDACAVARHPAFLARRWRASTRSARSRSPARVPPPATQCLVMTVYLGLGALVLWYLRASSLDNGMQSQPHIGGAFSDSQTPLTLTSRRTREFGQIPEPGRGSHQRPVMRGGGGQASLSPWPGLSRRPPQTRRGFRKLTSDTALQIH